MGYNQVNTLPCSSHEAGKRYAGKLGMARYIGAAYDQGTPETHSDTTRLADKSDAVMYFAEATPSALFSNSNLSARPRGA